MIRSIIWLLMQPQYQRSGTTVGERSVQAGHISLPASVQVYSVQVYSVQVYSVQVYSVQVYSVHTGICDNT